MAATVGTVIARDIKIYDGLNKIAELTEASLNVTKNFLSTASKESGGYETGRSGQKGFDLSASGLLANDATYGYGYLFAAALIGRMLSIRYTTEQDGNFEYFGGAYVSSLSCQGGVQENATFSVGFSGTGELGKVVTPVFVPLNPVVNILISDKLKLFVGGVEIGLLTNSSFSMTVEMIDVSTKASEGWKCVRPGQIGWECSADAHFTFDEAVGCDDLMTVLTGDAPVAVYFGSSAIGDKKYSGNAHITSLALKGGADDLETYTGQFKGTGGIVESVVA